MTVNRQPSTVISQQLTAAGRLSRTPQKASRLPAVLVKTPNFGTTVWENTYLASIAANPFKY
ncbi:hypothetical protein ACEYW6_02755 [Nostoc sp. UIC 10607]|uniref:hypothetical protein n=1 Tax=Nostoc sp. UIC 10607 TaxID=3045935 RepID=UPI0039A001A7